MKAFLTTGILAAALVLSGCAASQPSTLGGGDGAPPAMGEQEPSTEDTGAGADAGGAAPAPVVEEPAAPSQTSFEIGSPFDQSCSVAWPSAPVVTSTSIQLTLSCDGVPEAYPLVVAVYPDPDLAVTPATGRLRVSGTIADIGRSESGLVFLVVRASAITF